MISKFIFTKILGWKTVGNLPTTLNKYVVIAAPHTSWKDFPIAILGRNTFGTKINYIAKASLFKPPFGFIFRWLGGKPVERSKSTNKVDAIVAIFKQHNQFRLALSPEGTRKKVKKWKTGFYYIAKGAKVPIIMVTLDFGKKQILASEPYYLTDNMEADFKYFKNFYKDVIGDKPFFFNNESII